MDSVMKIGMVGLDTSHCPTFTRLLNNDGEQYHIPGARVVGAYPGGSAQFAMSRDRVQGFTDQMRDEFGVRIYDTIPELVRDVDAILLESSDGRQHLQQFTQLAVGKPVFVDKPLTTTTVDACGILELAQATRTPIMSCSSLRYAAGIADLVPPGEHVLSCEAFGPATLLNDFPGLFWYGIHSAEVLFAKMGPGCRQVQLIEHTDTDVAIGTWADGRIGVLRGTRVAQGSFGCVVHTDTATRCAVARSTPPYYALMLQEIAAFFATGVSPIDTAETWDIIAFVEAAERSRMSRGEPIETALMVRNSL